MASKQAATNDDRVYNDYEPPFEWQTVDGTNTLIVFLPGYRKQDLRVQITSRAKVRVSGERHVSENKWIRFSKEIPTPPDSNTNQITANFEHGMLYVKVAKATHQTKPSHEETKQPTQETPKPQKNYEEKVISKTIPEKQPRKEPSKMDEIKQIIQEKSAGTESKRGSDENKLSDSASHKEKKANEREEITSTSMSDSAKYKLRLEGYGQAVQNLFMEAKKRRLINLIMVVIFILLINSMFRMPIINPKVESKSLEL